MSRVSPKDFDAIRDLINEIQSLETNAHKLGMIETAHALNAAKNKAGWEFEGCILEHAKKGGLHDRQAHTRLSRRP